MKAGRMTAFVTFGVTAKDTGESEKVCFWKEGALSLTTVLAVRRRLEFKGYKQSIGHLREYENISLFKEGPQH